MADGMTVTEVRIQGPNHTGQSFRAIIKGTVDGRKFIAFHNAEDAKTLLEGVAARLADKSLKWLDDKPFGT